MITHNSSSTVDCPGAQSVLGSGIAAGCKVLEQRSGFCNGREVAHPRFGWPIRPYRPALQLGEITLTDEMPDTDFTRAVASARGHAELDAIISQTIASPPDPMSLLLAVMMLKLQFDLRGDQIGADALLQQSFTEMMEKALEFAVRIDSSQLIADFASRLSVLVGSSFGSNRRKRLERSISLGQLVLSQAESITDVDLLRYTARNVSNCLGHLFDELQRESSSPLGHLRAIVEGVEIDRDPAMLLESLSLSEFAVGLCAQDTHPLDRAYAIAARGAAHARIAASGDRAHFDPAQRDLEETRSLISEQPGERDFLSKMDIDLARLLIERAEAEGEVGDRDRLLAIADDQLLAVIDAPELAPRWRAEAAAVRVRLGRVRGDVDVVASLMREQLELTPPEVDPEGARALAAELAELTLSIDPSAWGTAADHYSTAAEITDMYLYGVGNDFADPQPMLDEYRLVNRNAAYCYSRTGEYQRAIELFEAGKCRVSGVLQRCTEEEVARLAIDLPDLAESFQVALDSLRVAATEQSDDLPTLRRRFAQSVRRVRAAGYRIFEPAKYAEIARRASRRAPIIFMINTPRGTVSLICSGADTPILPVWADDMTGRRISRLALGFDLDDGLRTVSIAPWQSSEEIALAAQSVVDSLRDELIAPLAGALATNGSLEYISLVTSGNLGALPLHAAGLSDIAPVKYLPASAFRLSDAELSERQRIVRTFYGLGDPPCPPAPRLPGAEAELHALVASRSGACRLALGELATVEFLQMALEDAADLHIACHASSSEDEHRGPVLLLADGRVSYGSIARMRRNQRVGLVVAAGCSTGALDTLTSQDESVTLATALLSMGATGAVTALWPVDDRACCLLFWRFSALWNASGYEPSAALADAARWLRELEEAEARRLSRLLMPEFPPPPPVASAGTSGARCPYESPFYWAPYVYTGS